MMACSLAESSSPSSSESRTVFTSEESDILMKAYEDGMKSAGALHSAQVAEISTRINKPVSVIKVLRMICIMTTDKSINKLMMK